MHGNRVWLRPGAGTVGAALLASPRLPGFSLRPVWPTGDGGNDVSMIQESDCGVGVEGKVSSQGRPPCGRWAVECSQAGGCPAPLPGSPFPLRDAAFSASGRSRLEDKAWGTLSPHILVLLPASQSPCRRVLQTKADFFFFFLLAKLN